MFHFYVSFSVVEHVHRFAHCPAHTATIYVKRLGQNMLNQASRWVGSRTTNVASNKCSHILSLSLSLSLSIYIYIYIEIDR